jgi:hypothetical protein
MRCSPYGLSLWSYDVVGHELAIVNHNYYFVRSTEYCTCRCKFGNLAFNKGRKLADLQILVVLGKSKVERIHQPLPRDMVA